jgi:transposase
VSKHDSLLILEVIFMKAISEDLRQRVADYIAAGHSRRAAARRFQISASSAIRVAALVRTTGSVAAKSGRPKRKSKLDPYLTYIVDLIGRRSDITLPELALDLLSNHGVNIHASNLSRLLIRHGFSYKKNAAGQRTRAC